MASERLHSPGDDVDPEPYTTPALEDFDPNRPNVLAVAVACAILTICAVVCLVAIGVAVNLARGG